jgi:ADP-ribosylglycohydrolase
MCSRSPKPAELEDRIRGVLLGLAAGDKIGGPLQMALLLAESIIEKRGFDASDYSGRLLQWHLKGSFDTGPITMAVFARAKAGVTFPAAARAVHERCRGMTAGCNPAHRCAPLALAATLQTEKLGAAAREQARLTHLHDLAGDAAAVIVILLRDLITGTAWDSAAQTVPAALLPSASHPLSEDGFSPNVLRAALHFVSAEATFAAALDASTSFAGPENYCPVLVGAIAGARWGASEIPAYSLVHCSAEDIARVNSAAAALTATWNPCSD